LWQKSRWVLVNAQTGKVKKGQFRCSLSPIPSLR
jgi:hypothetical protein